MNWLKLNDRYEISDFGDVRRIGSLNCLKPCARGDGYLVVNISGFRHKRNWKIHQLVAIAFIPNPEKKRSINHKNGIKTDNRLENLEWCTASENNKHAFRTLNRKPVSNNGFDNGFSKVVIDLSTGIFFGSASEAAVALNIKRSTLAAMLRGQNRNYTTLKFI